MVKFTGKVHLDSNLYSKIRLVQEDDIVNCKATKDEKLKCAKLIKTDVKTITNNIKDLNDSEKIKEIVLYFLRNNTICEIKQESNMIIVTSTSTRKLVLQLQADYKFLLELIIKKYEEDRIKFVSNSDLKHIHVRTTYLNNYKIISNVSSYFEGVELDGLDKKNECLVLTLLGQKDKIVSFDKNFIINFLSEEINNCSREIRMHINKYETNLYIMDKKISIPKILRDEIYPLVLNRNVEINEMNNKQLKLEGIKWKN